MNSKNDILRFLNTLSIRKGANFLLCYISYYISQWLRKPIVFHNPVMLSFEPTTNCNLGCPECPSGLKSFTRPTGNAPLELYSELLEAMRKDLIYLYLYFQGEPFMHKNIIDMILIAKKKKLYTVTSTNAHFITERLADEIVKSGLDRLIISIDGTTQEVYEQYRQKGQLEKVIKGTENIINAKKEQNSSSPHIIFQMLVVKPNEHQIKDVLELGKKLGVDEVIYKTAQIYNFQENTDLIPSIEKYARYRKNSRGEWEIKNKLKNQCWKLWHATVSTWDGKIIPCCFDKDAEYVMGEFPESSFHSVWKGDRYQNFRKQLLTSRASIDICRNCSEGTKVWESQV